MPFGNYYARTPEENSRLLNSGPGPAPMREAAAGLTNIADSLDGLASSAENQVSELSETWRGEASDNAQRAFQNNAIWLRQRAETAKAEAAKADNLANAYSAAKSSAARPAVIAANRAAYYALLPWSWKPWVAATLRVLDAMYMAMWIQSAVAMTGYDAASIPNITYPDSPTAPSIADPGGGSVPDNGGAGTGTNPSDGSSGTGGSGPSDGIGPTSPTDTGGAESGTNPGFFDTSTTSPTLSGLDGGGGSTVPVGMFTGGLGALAGAGSGFRMPSNWGTGSGGRMFGAPMTPAFGGPVGAGAPMGAIAPRGDTRRKRDRQRTRTGAEETVIAPDLHGEIPDRKSVV